MVENYGRISNGIDGATSTDCCDFLTVYISEAHAQDEWKLGRPDGVCVNQHKNLEERILAAKNFVGDFNYPSDSENTSMTIVVDSWDNDFDSTFAVWPERAFIIDGGRLSYISKPAPDGSIDWEKEVQHWLENRFQ